MLVTVRPREAHDFAALVPIAEDVYRQDGYPPHLPDGGLRGFLEAPTALAAWVAACGNDIAGHIALHPYTARSVMELAAATTGVAAGSLAAVSRLIVAPAARRHGVATRLLHTAVATAHARGLWPILDVAAAFTRSIAFYEACGWTCAGAVTIRFRDGATLESLVYIGPPPLVEP